MTTPTYIPAEQLEPGKTYIGTLGGHLTAIEVSADPKMVFIFGSEDAIASKLFKDIRPLDLAASVPELRERVKRLETLVDENYYELIEQMNQSWGATSSLCRPELNAFLASKIVHKPTKKLRERIAELERANSDLKSLSEELLSDRNSAKLNAKVGLFERAMVRIAQTSISEATRNFAAETLAASREGRK